MAQLGEIIVSSKVFRKYLKSVRDAYPDQEEISFTLDTDGILTAFSISLSVSLPVSSQIRDTITFEINTASINRMINVLKHILHQPILVGFEDAWNSFTLRTCNI